MKRYAFIGLLICLGLTCSFSSCDDKEEVKGGCDKEVVISATGYENAPNDPFSIIDMKIEGDCLKIKFSASGCSGDSWIVNLVDIGAVAKSDPPQRTLRLSLDNKEMCLTVIEKEISFNIKSLQIQGGKKVSLNISGKEILYNY